MPTVEFYVDEAVTVEVAEEQPISIEVEVPGPQGTGFKWRGAWAPATVYAINDVVTYLSQTWVAIANFTSAGAFNSANWQVMAGVRIYVQNTAPVAPALNDLWVDTS